MAGIFLDFVPSSKKKIAYAVSIGKSEFNDDELNTIKEYTKNFSFISVRERYFKKLTQCVDNKDITVALDPTLLLPLDSWNEVTPTRKIKEKYMFCYFLGSDKKMRSLATEYAREKNLSVVTIPHMQQRIESNDINFGDIQIYSARPQDFYLILNMLKLYSRIAFMPLFFKHIQGTVFSFQQDW